MDTCGDTMQPNKVAAAKSVTAERAGFAGFAVLSIIGLLSIIRTKKNGSWLPNSK
jgi:hypothetical protein